MRFLLTLLMFFGFSISQADNSCMTTGRWGYITSPDRRSVKFLAHYKDGIYVLHKCDKSSCEIIQRGTSQQLCQIEESNHRNQKMVYGAIKGFANSASAVKIAARAAITTALHDSKQCAATAAIHAMVNQKDASQSLAAYYKIASHLHFLPGQRLFNQLRHRNSQKVAINNFASENFQHSFTTPETTKYFQSFGEIITPRFSVSPNANQSAYCELFKPRRQQQQAPTQPATVAI